MLLQASSQGPPVSAVVYAAADLWLSTVHLVPLLLFSKFGAIYKYSDLLTYLLCYPCCSRALCFISCDNTCKCSRFYCDVNLFSCLRFVDWQEPIHIPGMISASAWVYISFELCIKNFSLYTTIDNVSVSVGHLDHDLLTVYSSIEHMTWNEITCLKIIINYRCIISKKLQEAVFWYDTIR